MLQGGDQVKGFRASFGRQTFRSASRPRVARRIAPPPGRRRPDADAGRRSRLIAAFVVRVAKTRVRLIGALRFQ